MASQVWASGKRKPIPVSGLPRRRRRLRIRSRRHGVAAALWALTTSVFTIGWLTLGGTLWFIAAVFGALASVMAAIAAFSPDDVVPAPTGKKPAGGSPRGNGPRGPRGSSGGGRKPRRLVCSARCRDSVQPVSECECSCRGKTHGVRATGHSARPRPASQTARPVETVQQGGGAPEPTMATQPDRSTRGHGVSNGDQVRSDGLPHAWHAGKAGSVVATDRDKGLVTVNYPGHGTVTMPESAVVPTGPRPANGAPTEPVHHPGAQRGWRSLRPESKTSMSAHAKASPRCASGAVTARTIRDNRTSPPTITQSITCDTCGAAL